MAAFMWYSAFGLLVLAVSSKAGGPGPGIYGAIGGYLYGSRCQRVILESLGPLQPAWKKIGFGFGPPIYLGSIELVRQWSIVPCILGQNLFSKGYKVVATDGCQGEFLVCFW